MARHARSSARLAAAGALCALILPLLAAGRPATEAADLHKMLEDYRRPAASAASAEGADPARIALGEKLFFDPRLSGSDTMACASCHNPGFAWTDPLPRAVGHDTKTLRRRTPTILNLAWGELFYWDGRAASLEEQALGPITSAEEMNLSEEDLVAKLMGIPGYVALFEEVDPEAGITADTVASALASFERTVVSGEAPFDRWVQGDADAVSEAARRGFVLFEGKARCATCHEGWRFTDDSFHDIGVGGDDRGRAEVLEGIPAMEHAFKTPTLRDVARRAPYMHDGSEATLGDVIELYDRGGDVRRPSLSREIVPLELSDRERRDLVAFLETLTSDPKPVAIPALPR